MICPHCGKQFKDEGRAKGGRKSKRTISESQQKEMQDARKAVLKKSVFVGEDEK